MTVIPNGYDTCRFRPDLESRSAIRSELGMECDAPIVTYAARFDPQKDHHTFLRAAAKVAATMPHVHFILCGSDVTPANEALTAWSRDLALDGRIHLLGPRRDIERIYAATDVAASSSLMEGFPNTLAEAMACGAAIAASYRVRLFDEAGYKGYFALEYESDSAPENFPPLAVKLRDLARKYSG